MRFLLVTHFKEFRIGKRSNHWGKVRQPKNGDIHKPLSKFSPRPYARRFGGFRNALEQFIAYINNGEKNESTKTVENLPTGTFSKHRTPRQANHRLRYLVLRRDNFKCQACGKSPATHPNIELEIDHVIPWEKGGETLMENLQSLCTKCNGGKSNLE